MDHDHQLFITLQRLPRAELANLIVAVCERAGYPKAEAGAYGLALVERLAPDRPMTAKEVLAATLLKQKPHKTA